METSFETTKDFRDIALHHGVPEHDIDGLYMYVVHGVPLGSFLEAVVSNNLRDAFSMADHINQQFLKEIVSFLYNEFPSASWGSRERYEGWIKTKKAEREAEEKNVL